MGVILRIGDAERDLFQADEHWNISQIERRKTDQDRVGIEILVDLDNIQLRLTTPDIPVGGGTRPPREEELATINLWGEMGLNEADYNGGKLIAFRSRLKKMI